MNRCRYCGLESQTDTPSSHKCPNAIVHLGSVSDALQAAEELTVRIRGAVRAYTFGREFHADAQLAQALGESSVLRQALGRLVALNATAPAKPDDADLLREREVQTIAAAQSRSAAFAEAREVLDMLHRIVPAPLLDERRDVWRDAIAGWTRTERLHVASWLNTLDTLAPSQSVVTPASLMILDGWPYPATISRANLSSDADELDRMALAAILRPTPGKVFIEEHPELGNKPMPEAYADLIAELEAMGEGYVLARCNLGHAWKTSSDDPRPCPEKGCEMPAPMLFMSSKSVPTLRRIASLAPGATLARCSQKHEWEAGRDAPKDAATGRPACPECGEAAEVAFAGFLAPRGAL